MTSYQQITSAFQKVGLFEDELVSKHQIKTALDKLCSQNARINAFDPEVADELWDETQKQTADNVYLREYIQTIMRGESILKN